MSQLDLLPTSTTILRTPSWLGLGIHEEIELPNEPGDYKVTPGDDRWAVTCLKTGERVYWGIGPVEVVRSPAPF